MVDSSRQHLAERYSAGVYRLLWEQEKRPMPDAEAVRAVVSAAADGRADVLDVGAALVIVQAMRLELDLLEANVFDAAGDSGVPDESVAAVLELPGAAAAAARRRMLSAKRDLPRLAPDAPSPGRPEIAREAAGRAGRRAASAATRAAEAARNREQFRRQRRTRAAAGKTSPEDIETASAHASEARISSREANERVAMALLRAADTLDDLAKRNHEREHAAASGRDREQLKLRATEYAQTAELYRQMADQHLRRGEGTY
jgi:hypothetical protein